MGVLAGLDVPYYLGDGNLLCSYSILIRTRPLQSLDQLFFRFTNGMVQPCSSPPARSDWHAQSLEALCLSWVKNGKAQSEQMSSGLPSITDIARTCGNGREVPEPDVGPLATKLCPAAAGRVPCSPGWGHEVRVSIGHLITSILLSHRADYDTAEDRKPIGWSSSGHELSLEAHPHSSRWPLKGNLIAGVSALRRQRVTVEQRSMGEARARSDKVEPTLITCASYKQDAAPAVHLRRRPQARRFDEAVLLARPNRRQRVVLNKINLA
jgi:hypothetical protein